MYDPRVGRFFAVDPLFKEYPELTPYQFASNSPIDMLEIEGLEGGWIVNQQGKVQHAYLGPVNDTYFSSLQDAYEAASHGLKKPSHLALYNQFFSRRPSVQRPTAEIRQLNYHEKYSTHNPGYVMAPMMKAGAQEIVEDAFLGGVLTKIGKGILLVKTYNQFKKVERLTKGADGLFDVVQDVNKVYSSNRSLVYWTKSKTLNDIKVFQRDDIFDPKTISSWKENGKTITGTNVQRMASGRAPVGIDGKPVNLHHGLQTNDSNLYEMTETFHKTNHKTIHINDNSIPSGINRAEFDKIRESYWKERATDFINTTE